MGTSVLCEYSMYPSIPYVQTPKFMHENFVRGDGCGDDKEYGGGPDPGCSYKGFLDCDLPILDGKKDAIATSNFKNLIVSILVV
ncbi:hypothetical protein L1987_37792 [Smallanthus sonchifolius]|uniref:Uncharacterized protein n=1 Tax=Smallanthus sonchifolius TaxID=185202 RepID=A0ACB9HGW5_9ASTR|nr:hypothetical protein L1987_37792 [Smallanthus sonchifolius]